MAKEVTDATFEAEVLKAGKVAVVDFWAPWCGPCRIIAPVIEELSKEYQGKVLVAKMNVDENPTTPARYGIRAIPTIIFFKNGKEYTRQVGAVGKAELKRIIDQMLESE